MQFELTDEIVNQIIFSMEDQSQQRVFDSEKKDLVAFNPEEQQDGSRFYPLPAWDSVSGFSIMERFVSELRNPPVKEKLRTVLSAGKGVFRGFKDVLKEHPEVETLWFAFKERALKHEISAWYNLLRDSWGLEKIGEEPEETDELVYADFIFRTYDAETDTDSLRKARICAQEEICSVYESGLAETILFLQNSSRPHGKEDAEYTLTAHTAEGEFAGFISALPCPEGSHKTVLITAFYVLSAWRGLGIGKSLFTRCTEKLKNTGVRYIIVPSIHIPDFFEHIMFRSGFQRIPAGFYADTDTQKGTAKNFGF